LYEKFRSDPEKWTIKTLAQHYGANPERVKAILFLYDMRFKMMEDNKISEITPRCVEMAEKHQNNLVKLGILEDGYEDDDGEDENLEGEEVGEEKKVKLATEGPFSTSELVTVAGEESESAPALAVPEEEMKTPQDSFAAIAKEYKMSTEQAEEIIKRVLDHAFRLRNQKVYLEDMDGLMERYEEEGIDTTFKETGFAPKPGTAVQENFYPDLFGDEGEEYAKHVLLARIAKETKAQIDDFDLTASFLSKGKRTYELPEDSPNAAAVKRDHLCRWKYAFKDISKKPGVQPTMIRTRRGAWRQANPLEEALRSWTRNPTPLDLYTYRESLKPFIDPDGDEQEAKQLVLKKLEKQKAFAASRANKAIKA